MTTNTDREPTLRDVIDKIDNLSSDVESLSKRVDTFEDKFTNYQQATQWVVQLAFGLIASATVIVIVTNIFK